MVWDKYLSLVAMAYRFAVNELTGQTQANLLFGHDMGLSCDLEFGSYSNACPVSNFWLTRAVRGFLIY